MLTQYFNKYSVIGALIYAVICVTGTIMTPEITSPFIYLLGFISSCMFYFMMYVLYKRRKRRTWKELSWFIAKCFGYYYLVYCVFIMFVKSYYHLSLIEASIKAAHMLSTFLYYVIFIP